MATKNPFQGDDVDPFEAARDTETGEIKREAPKAEAPKAEAPKRQSFGQAFAAARKAGDKTFMFGGKKFTTERADDKPAAKASPAKSSSEYSTATDAMRNKSRAASANPKSINTDVLRNRSRKEAAYAAAKRKAVTPEGKAKLEEQSRQQAVKRVTPEEYLGPGFGLKAASKIAEKLAKPKIKEYNPTLLPGPKKELPPPVDKRAIKDKERADRRRYREAEKEVDNIKRGGQGKFGSTIELKKGGSVRGYGLARGGKKCKII